MKIAILIVRLLLGLIFLVFGLNQFLHFIPMQMPTGPAGEFLTGMMSAKYFIPLLGTIQVLCGVLLLTNKFVPLALIMLLPVTLNIFFFHVVLAPEGMLMGSVVFLMNAFLIYAYRNYYLTLQEPVAKHPHG